MPRLASSKAPGVGPNGSPSASDPMLPPRSFASRSAARRRACYQWKRKHASAPQSSAFLRVQTSEPTKDTIEIKLPEAGERREA
jgi:hypothetical protein